MTSSPANNPDSARLGPGVAAGVTETLIHDQIHAFYGKIRTDPALGPIFNRAITDWDHHLNKMCDFWSAVLLMTGRFKGAPMAVHAALPVIRPTHFARWLHLFRQTAEDVCPPDAAALFIAKSEIIAQAFQLHLSATRDEPAWAELSVVPRQRG